MTQKHTPTPWNMDRKSAQGFVICGNGGTKGTDCIAKIQSYGAQYGHDDEANADFIVRACNSHDALVEAVESLISSLEAVTSEKRNIFKNKDQMRQFISGDIQKANAALALAKGES